jgi:dinuclear metal center YbgI/SA1388 family protein
MRKNFTGLKYKLMWKAGILFSMDSCPQIGTFALPLIRTSKMKLKEITDHLESIAPLAYQESYDNAGLICGNSDMEIKAALICLDSTEGVLDEAIERGCNLVIAHHPIVFSGLKKFNGKNYVERVIMKAIRNDIAIYASHTNLDNVHSGVNAKIAEKIGLKNCRVLSAQKNKLKKLITFCPEDKAEGLRTALFSAGAGKIGNYDECSFNTNGTGTFKAGESSDPYVGKKGEQHQEKEIRIEILFPAYLESKILSALIKAHPYEEVAFDIISLDNLNQEVGSGLIGDLDEMDEMEFLKQIKTVMKAESLRFTTLKGKKVKKVCCLWRLRQLFTFGCHTCRCRCFCDCRF